MVMANLENAYDLVDYMLTGLNNGELNSLYYNWEDSADETSIQLAISIILEHYLVIQQRPGDKDSTTSISTNGIEVVNQGGIRNFLNAKKSKQISKSDFEALLFDNEKLRNAEFLLKEQNAELDSGFRKSQDELIKLQINEIKTKKVWGVIGAIAGAGLTLIIDNWQYILRFLQRLFR